MSSEYIISCDKQYKELDLRGSLDVLRNGFVDYGVRFQMAYFQPASGLNPDAVELYNKNKLKVYRQIYYSTRDNREILFAFKKRALVHFAVDWAGYVLPGTLISRGH